MTLNPKINVFSVFNDFWLQPKIRATLKYIWLKVAGDVDAKAADLYAINVSL